MPNPLDLDDLALNHVGRPDDLALAMGTVYRDSAGRLTEDSPRPTAPTDPDPVRFEPARDFGPRRIPGAITGFDGDAPDEHAWQTSWDDDGRPWWVEEYAAELVEQDRQQVMQAHSPYYSRVFDPPVEDPDVIYRSTPETADFIRRAREQGMP